MTPANNSNADFYILIGIVAIIVIIFVICVLCQFINNFSLELRYLNNEIKRTRGAERIYWIRRRRRLWLSLIPFIKY